MQSVRIQGVLANLVTPFESGGKVVDRATLVRLVDRLIERGVQGIAALGHPGEQSFLGADEWERAAEAIVTQTAARVPTLIDVSAGTTAECVRRAKFAEANGASVIVLAPLFDSSLSKGEICEHYASVSDAVSIPIMVRNDPTHTSVDLAPEFLVELTDAIENATMVLECSGEFDRFQRLFHLTQGRLPFVSGSNTLALASFAAGAAGWCSTVAHWIPELAVELWEASFRSDLHDARELFYRQLPLLELLDAEHDSPATVKCGLQALGFDAGLPSEPNPIDDERAAALAKALARCGAANEAQAEAA